MVLYSSENTNPLKGGSLNLMELFLQFGHGMKALTLDLSKKWDKTSVILSPRDMAPTQLKTWSIEFQKAGVQCYFDPQCYCPKSELKRLSQYSYWDSNLNTKLQQNNTPIDQQIQEIKNCNDIAKSVAYILPSILNNYDSSWANRFLRQTKRIIDSGHKYMNDKPLLATLTFPKDFLVQNENTIEPVLQAILDLDVDGFYIISEDLDRKYLADNPMWLSNVLHICATLKISGKKIVFGYGNHQLLPLALLRTDAMASGSWLNVRSFTNRFIDTDEQKRKSTWVYYPEALSEYKLSFMDWAFNHGHLASMKSKDKDFLDEGISKIFQSSAPPSATGFNETDAFKHYLCCLKHQVSLLNRPSYQETLDSYEMLLVTAEREIERLEKCGVYAQTRSFRDVIDVNRAAVTQLKRSHGFSLKMSWDSL